MVDPIDVPEFTSTPLRNKRLKAIVRSNPEHDREGFSQALKEKMEDNLHHKRAKKQGDEYLGSQEEPDENDSEDKQQKPPEELDDSKSEESESKKEQPTDGHIDLKA